MKKSVSVFAALVALGLGAGCAHVHKVDGPQEKSEIPSGIRVGIGGQEVQEGDTVSVYTTNCKDVPRLRTGSGRQCQDVEVGKALVLKVLDHDSAIVAPQNGLTMDTSMKVEKQKGAQQ